MKRHKFLAGIMVTLVLIFCSAYIVDTGQDWRLTGTTLEDSRFSGSFAINVAGDIFYVDGNKLVDTGNGKTWKTAFQKLSTAITASNTDISVSADRQWAARNVIYVMGDTITEDFTVLPKKCDVIGVGSNNPYNKPGIVGTWIIDGTATEGMSCRFFNVQFYDDGAGGSLWDVTSIGGLEFYNCLFQASATSSVGFEANDCGHLKIVGCWFGSADGQNFTSAAIQVQNHSTGAFGILIKDNRIHSDGVGIDWNEATNVDCWIDGNRFFTTTMIIDTDDAAEVMIVDNIGITLLAAGDNTAYDFDLAYAVGNIFTANNDTNNVPSI